MRLFIELNQSGTPVMVNVDHITTFEPTNMGKKTLIMFLSSEVEVFDETVTNVKQIIREQMA